MRGVSANPASPHFEKSQPINTGVFREDSIKIGREESVWQHHCGSPMSYYFGIVRYKTKYNTRYSRHGGTMESLWQTATWTSFSFIPVKCSFKNNRRERENPQD